MAQFVVKPPLAVVGPLFSAATGHELKIGVSWDTFKIIPDDLLEAVRPYIRPCHQDVLDRTLAGGSPLTLLRQLLRPHGFRIETTTKGWRLYDPSHPCVAHVKGGTVQWG